MPDLLKKPVARWLALLALSLLIAIVLELIGSPAAFMLGAMLAGIIATIKNWQLALPGPFLSLSQSIIGCLIGSSITLNVLPHNVQTTGLFIGITVAVLAISLFIGVIVSKIQVLPGSTGIWGSLPGAAPMMIILSERYGADSRLVAFVQYTRVVMVAFAAALLVGLISDTPSNHSTHLNELLEFSAVQIAGPGLVIAATFAVARLIPPLANIFLLSIAISFALGSCGWLSVHPPFWLQILGFLLLGWSIGLRFTREVRIAAARAFLQVFGLLVAMISLCLIPASVLVFFYDIDPLSAYLATSPGGVDSIAIIAAGSAVNMPFIIGAQMVRFIVVLLIGPALTRYVAHRFHLLPGPSAKGQN